MSVMATMRVRARRDVFAELMQVVSADDAVALIEMLTGGNAPWQVTVHGRHIVKSVRIPKGNDAGRMLVSGADGAEAGAAGSSGAGGMNGSSDVDAASADEAGAGDDQADGQDAGAAGASSVRPGRRRSRIG